MCVACVLSETMFCSVPRYIHVLSSCYRYRYKHIPPEGSPTEQAVSYRSNFIRQTYDLVIPLSLDSSVEKILHNKKLSFSLAHIVYIIICIHTVD